MSSRPIGDGGLDDEAVDALLRGESGVDVVLAECLDALRGAADGPAPRPSVDLLALLEGGLRDDLAARRGARRPVKAATVAVAAAGVLGLSGVAAAHDELPGPVNRVVNDIVEQTTPFVVERAPRQAPKPAGDGDRRSVAPSDVPAPDHSLTRVTTTSGRTAAAPWPGGDDRTTIPRSGTPTSGDRQPRTGDRHGGGSGDGRDGRVDARGSGRGGSGNGHGQRSRGAADSDATHSAGRGVTHGAGRGAAHGSRHGGSGRSGRSGRHGG